MLPHLGGRSDGPERVVLMHPRQAEDGHDRVTDVLLDRAAVPLEGLAHFIEIPRHHLADSLGVQLLAHRGRALEV